MIETLIDRDSITERVAELGREISEYYKERDFMLVMLANGGVFFGVDLARAITIDFPMDIIAAASYHNDRQGDELIFRCSPKLDLKNKHILLVDEVLDSGVTLARTVEELKKLGAEDVKTAVLVTKERARKPEAVHCADWSGFTLPDVYLVGLGLDTNELCRNLPFLGVVK